MSISNYGVRMGFLDLSSDPAPRRGHDSEEVTVRSPLSDQNTGQSPPKRKFLGIKFNCCGVYHHIYINKDGTAYEGRCPKCMVPIRLKIGD